MQLRGGGGEGDLAGDALREAHAEGLEAVQEAGLGARGSRPEPHRELVVAGQQGQPLAHAAHQLPQRHQHAEGAIPQQTPRACSRPVLVRA